MKKETKKTTTKVEEPKFELIRLKSKEQGIKSKDVHNFRKLNIWLKSIELVTDIYKLTSLFPNSERFGIVSQMQRAALSCPTNIAEGSAKSSNKDFARFLEISLGSLL